MTIKKYHQKRNFKVTKEPKASITKAKVKKNKELIFVIQKHAASHLHYDFRLEMHHVLKSWAVPKGPSINPQDKKLAIMVEDHPYDYKDFEGIIPKGNYGAGAVIIWDEGFYYYKEGLSKAQNEKILTEELKNGRISFYLEGKKLKGKFSLVKIKSRGENSWLLVKKHDEFISEEDIKLNNTSIRSGKTIEELAAENNLKKKITTQKKPVKEPVLLSSAQNLRPSISKTIEAEKNSLSITSRKNRNSISPPNDFKPMLAITVDKPFDNENWIFEIKWDGYRAMAILNSGNVQLYSRNNKSFNLKFPSIANALESINIKAVLDGEIVAVDSNGLPSFQLLQNYKAEELNLVYYIFDILWLNGEDLRSLPLIIRKEKLKKVLEKIHDPHIVYSDHIENDGILFLKEAEKKGLEGIIAKRAAGKYFAGRRTNEWLKIKTYKRQEAIICGYTKPRKSRKHFGALILGAYDNNGKLTYIGHSGGGFDQKTLHELKERMDKIVIKTSPFKDVPKTNMKPTWVKPELVCEVRFTQWTEEGLMRHPVYIGAREDKEASEVIIEKEKEVEPIIKGNIKEKVTVKKRNQTKARKKGFDKEITIKGNKIELTNLDKIYFPDEGYTKGDIIDYYQKISRYLLPYLKNRPQSMNRHPNGIKGKNFFQKNVKNMLPEWIQTIEVPSESKGKIKFLVCQDKATLIYMANLGCIEINPWSSRIECLENPDYLIIDLDPLDVNFELVIETAQTVKKVLDAARIAAFIKTSGSKGIHILVPLGAKYTYETCKNFAHIIAKIVYNQLPDITSILRSPSKRKNKVYLDYLQNNRGQTIAAPYCVRPRPGATVSTPLKWEELKKGLHPSQFTIENIFKRLEEYGDIFKGLLKHKGINMEQCLKRLEKFM